MTDQEEIDATADYNAALKHFAAKLRAHVHDSCVLRMSLKKINDDGTITALSPTNPEHDKKLRWLHDSIRKLEKLV